MKFPRAFSCSPSSSRLFLLTDISTITNQSVCWATPRYLSSRTGGPRRGWWGAAGWREGGSWGRRVCSSSRSRGVRGLRTHSLLRFRWNSHQNWFRVGGDVVSCPNIWSLYCYLDFCDDHHPESRMTGDSNLLAFQGGVDFQPAGRGYLAPLDVSTSHLFLCTYWLLLIKDGVVCQLGPHHWFLANWAPDNLGLNSPRTILMRKCN